MPHLVDFSGGMDDTMRTMYKPSEYEMKLIVLYVIKYLRTSATYTILDYVISSVVDMDYFVLQEYIGTLMEVGDLAEFEIENDKVYSLTPSGEETIGFFADKIPYSIREKLTTCVNNTNKEQNSENDITCDYYPINNTEYCVKFHMKENNVTMLALDVYIGDKETAKKASEYLLASTGDAYSKIMEIINSGIDNLK